MERKKSKYDSTFPLKRMILLTRSNERRIMFRKLQHFSEIKD